MTKDEIRDCVAKWQERLWLQGWRIEIDFDSPPARDDATVEILRASDYLRAEIRLAPGWRDWSRDAFGETSEGHFRPETLDHTIAHEMTHLVLHDLSVAGRLEFGELARDLDRIHDADIDHQLERATDQIAAILVRAFGEN